MVGDAAGGTMEGAWANDITEENVLFAMRMPGGGRWWNLGPGQVTDDSELMMAQLRGLLNAVPSTTKAFPEEAVAREYIAWHRSVPFDLGRTCARAFGFCNDTIEMKHNAATYNLPSEANGALMRCAPIAVWGVGQGLSGAEIAECARADARLSHPNPVCQDANAAFCVALAHLIRHAGDAQGALAAVAHELERPEVSPVVRTWFSEVVHAPDPKLYLDGRAVDCRVHVGHVRHAFRLALGFLRLPECSFEDAIRRTLAKGGDTDTNACIVGYMMGALHGYDAIPAHMRDPVLTFDCTTYDIRRNLKGYRRPPAYRQAGVPALVMQCLSALTK